MTRHTYVRLAHDVGLYAFFGGSLMGATSLNAAASQLDDPRQRARAATRGWSRWAPVSAAALATHLAGGAGLLLTDLPRVTGQRGVGRSTAVKTAVTAATVGASAWSAVLNRRMAAAGDVPVSGATEPSAVTPPDVARTQRQLKVVQWLDPLLGGALVVLTSLHSEQQRPAQVAAGTVRRIGAGVATPVPLAVTGAAVAALAAARRRRSSQRDGGAVYPVAPDPVVVPATSTPASPVGASASAPSTSTAPLRSGPPLGSYAPAPSATPSTSPTVTVNDRLDGGSTR